MFKLVLTIGIYISLVLALGFVLAWSSQHESLDYDPREEE